MNPLAFSFRNLPASIYLGVGLGFLGSITYAIAFLLASGEGFERYEDVERARIFNLGCQYAQVLLCSFGLFALARRHVGPARPLAQTAAWLMFIGLSYPFLNLAVSIVEPRDPRAIYDAFGLMETVVMLAATILLTIAADAWRRVLPAAIGLVVLLATSYSFPVIGKLIARTLDDDTTLRIYYLAREAAWVASFLFVAAALAAGGRDVAPDPQRAASGFRIAHTSLIIRLVAVFALVLMGFAARSPGVATLAIVVGPLVIIATLIMFAVGVLRADSANLPGMPRFRLAVAAAGLFWFASLQLEQVAYIIGAVWDGNFDVEELEHVQLFSVIGPLVVSISLALVGSAIASFAANRGNVTLASSASSRTFAFVVFAVGGIALQSFMPGSTPAGSAPVGLIAAVAGVASFIVLLGLVKTASEQVDVEPGIPPARVVSDS